MRLPRALFVLIVSASASGALVAAQPEGTMAVRLPPGAEIRIGIGTLLSGQRAALGREVLDGAEAFCRDHPLLLGHRLALVPLDDGCDLEQTKRRAREFCSMSPPPAAVVGYLCTAGTLSALPIHGQCGLPLLNVSSADPHLTRSGSPWLLRLWSSLGRQGPLAARWARRRGLRRIVVIHASDPASTAIVEAFQEALKRIYRGARATAVPLSEAQAKISGLFDAKPAPQLCFYVGGGPNMGGLWREMPKPALGRPWILDERIETRWMADDHLEKPARIYRMEILLPTGDPDSPPFQYFRRRFGEPGIYTLAAYDALSVLADAIQRSSQKGPSGLRWDPKQLAKALRETNLHGLTGPLSFDAAGDRIKIPGRILQWREGKWIPRWKTLLP